MGSASRKTKEYGWTVFIFRCGDGSYYTGMCDDFRKRLWEIENGPNVYFTNHPERKPLTLVFKEKQLPFKEAYAKAQYMKRMTRKQKERLITKNLWPIGGKIREYMDREMLENG